MRIQGVNHLCFSVSDLNASIAFYQDALGARLVAKGRKLAYFDLAGLWIALNEEEGEAEQGRTAPSSYTHIAFTVAEEELEAFEARLRSLGADVLPGRPRDPRDRPSLYFKDPDGHMFELHAGSLRDRLAYYREAKPHVRLFGNDAAGDSTAGDSAAGEPRPLGETRIESIRAIEGEDRGGLARLLIDVVADGASVGFLPPLTAAEAERYWAGVMDGSTVLWVARHGGDVVGTVQLQLCGRANGEHRAEIAKLMVHPRAQRQGIGRRLMEAAEERARKEGRSLLVLDTRAGDPSNRLYRALGYTEAGSIPQYARSADGSFDATVIYYKLL